MFEMWMGRMYLSPKNIACRWSMSITLSFPYSTNVLKFIFWSIYVAIQDAKARHFQYYKYLLQILVLMLSLKRKETLLRVQCTGDFYQYFSSKVKHYMFPGYCPLHSSESSLSPLLKTACASLPHPLPHWERRVEIQMQHGMSGYWLSHPYHMWQCRRLWRKSSEWMWLLLDVAPFFLSERALENEGEWRVPDSLLLWLNVLVLAIFLTLEKSMGLNLPLKLEEIRLWMCSKVLNLGYSDSKHPSKHFNY